MADDLDVGLLDVPGGLITLRDEGSRATWTVRVERFALAARPVTRVLWTAVTGEPAPGATGSRTPVTEVSWLDAVAFCNRLSATEGLRPCYRGGADPDGLDVVWDPDADGYRLPTEAEWEHACRAGSNDVRHGPLDAIAWHRGNADGAPHEVGSKAPNAWGLHDMLGNVWEWCWDLFDPQVYGPYRVFRGGGWADLPHACRASARRKSHPTLRIDDLGFRLARST